MSAVYVYTSFYQVNLDLNLYIAIKTKQTLTLTMFPQLAIDRWSWIVSQWKQLNPRFTKFANGEHYYMNALIDMANSVESYLIGDKANALNSPDKFVLYSDFLDLITLNEMKLNIQEQNKVNEQVRIVSNFDITRFRAMLSFLKQQSVLTAMYLGLADATSAAQRGMALVAKKRNATFNDMQVMNNGIELEKFIEGIIVDLKNITGLPPNLLAAANNNIDPNSSVVINNNYLSYVSVVFSGTLQKMAQKYLGSVDQWYELVTVNNLKAPFIDDVGTKVPLLSSGSGNTIYISNAQQESVRVSSKVAVGSYRYREQIRIVEKVTDNKDGTLTVFLSGDKTLSSLSIKDKPYVRVYKPGTITTGSFILIPRNIIAVSRKNPTPQSDLLKRMDNALLNFGVDIQRSEQTNDIIVDPSGNFQMAYGISNIRQAVLTVLRTEKGELPYWPSFGLPQTIGTRYFGTLSETQILSDVVSAAVKGDQRFQSVIVTDLNTAGNSVSMSLNAFVVGANNSIPLSFIG